VLMGVWHTFRWQTLCIMSEAEWIVPHVIAFVKSQVGQCVYVSHAKCTIYCFCATSH
jgi:hypothetical protein